MSRLVLETSVALAWCFEDETSAGADRIPDLLASSEALVPAIGPVEVGNALLAGERRRRIMPAETVRSLELPGSLNIRVDDAGLRLRVDELVALARPEGWQRQVKVRMAPTILVSSAVRFRYTPGGDHGSPGGPVSWGARRV